MSDIPTKSREILRERDNRQCQRCGCSGNQYHHRRRRRVGGHDPHCPCNGVTLCGDCHRWAHAFPEEARETGFILAEWQAEPFTIPLQLWNGSWARHSCDGGTDFAYGWKRGTEGSPPEPDPEFLSAGDRKHERNK